MKKLLVISALLNVALLTGLTWREMFAYAQGDPVEECLIQNGNAQ